MDMNEKQRKVLYIVIMLVLVMVISPPYHHPFGESCGKFLYLKDETGGCVVNYLLLIVQLLAVVVIGCVAFLLTGNRREK